MARNGYENAIQTNTKMIIRTKEINVHKKKRPYGSFAQMLAFGGLPSNQLHLINRHVRIEH